MNVLSLFDGISCGQVALERAGIKYDKYYASEVNEKSIQITQNNYPNTIQLGDVCGVNKDDLPKIDLLIGGSPCQGFSYAGKLLNFGDERSKLFFEYARLLKETKPKHFLLENVNMRKEYQDIISSFLGVEPVEINSNIIAPMRRRRLYWSNIEFVLPKKADHSLLDCLDEFVNEKYYLSDDSMGKITYKSNGNLYIRNLNNKELMLEEGDSIVLSRTWQVYMPVVKNESMCIRASNPDDIGVIVSKDGKLTARKFTVNEMERLQTLPINYTEGFSERQRKSMIGDGWTVDVIAHIFKGLK